MTLGHKALGDLADEEGDGAELRSLEEGRLRSDLPANSSNPGNFKG